MAKTKEKIITTFTVQMSPKLREITRKLADMQNRSSSNYVKLLITQEAEKAGLIQANGAQTKNEAVATQ